MKREFDVAFLDTPTVEKGSKVDPFGLRQSLFKRLPYRRRRFVVADVADAKPTGTLRRQDREGFLAHQRWLYDAHILKPKHLAGLHPHEESIDRGDQHWLAVRAQNQHRRGIVAVVIAEVAKITVHLARGTERAPLSVDH